MSYHHDFSSEPITVEGIEYCLDRLALAIKANGKNGRKLLPMFKFLQEQLQVMKEADETMAAVLSRVQGLR